MPWITLLGRVFMAAIFVQAGFNKAMAATATIAYFTKLGLPVPGAAYALTVLVELGGGLAFLVGWRIVWVAPLLAAWCIATALIGHYPLVDRNTSIHFMKNLCMAGGFLQVWAYGAGRFSLDRR